MSSVAWIVFQFSQEMDSYYIEKWGGLLTVKIWWPTPKVWYLYHGPPLDCVSIFKTHPSWANSGFKKGSNFYNIQSTVHEAPWGDKFRRQLTLSFAFGERKHDPRSGNCGQLIVWKRHLMHSVSTYAAFLSNIHAPFVPNYKCCVIFHDPPNTVPFFMTHS